MKKCIRSSCDYVAPRSPNFYVKCFSEINVEDGNFSRQSFEVVVPFFSTIYSSSTSSLSHFMASGNVL